MSSPSHKEVELYRNSRGIRGPIPNIMTQSSARIPIILPTNPASDFPSVVPEHVTHCGPIVRPCGRLVEEHPELNTWLSQRPTVLISMGSMVSFKVEAQRQFAEGLRMLLETNSDIQVLWKMPREGLDTDEGFKSIDAYISEGRIRIEDWLTASPICILLSGHVKCMVHHGGSNSYHEAILCVPVNLSHQHPVMLTHYLEPEFRRLFFLSGLTLSNSLRASSG